MKKLNLGFSIVAFTIITMIGCGSSTKDVATGPLNLSITNGNLDSAKNVFVKFSGFEVHSNSLGTQQFSFEEPKTIDILSLQDDDSTALLEDVTLEAGSYQWLRLKVVTEGDLDTYIVLDNGSTYEVEIPSGFDSDLKFKRNFEIPANGTVNFTIDFDLRKSLTLIPPDTNPVYELRTTLRITDNN